MLLFQYECFMESLKYKVRRNMLKQMHDYRESPTWLNRGKKFNHSLRLCTSEYDRFNEIFSLCKVANRKENQLNLNILLANLVSHKYRRPIAVSLNVNDWKKNRYIKAGPTTTTLIYRLFELGFINLKKGYKNEKESRSSRIWATNKLFEYFPRSSTIVVNEPSELVELRDSNGKSVDFKDTVKTRRIRKILESVNRVNRYVNISFEGDPLSCSLVAIYNRKFTLYGRLHTTGNNHYQGLSSSERSEITINGKPVVELDYSGLHPHLLYANEGIQFEGDPYSMVDERPQARKLLKHILLCMLNSPNEITAERAANKWLYDNPEERKRLKSLGITRARPFIIAFKQSHKKISHYFCHGVKTGLKIMNRDSSIALDIINTFAKQGIPILAIHDSFIVQEQHKDYLLTQMKDAYARNTGGFRITIKGGDKYY